MYSSVATMKRPMSAKRYLRNLFSEWARAVARIRTISKPTMNQ